MTTRINRLMRASHHSATRQATPLCAVAAIAAFVAGLPAGFVLGLGGLAVISYVLRPSSTVQI